MPFETFRKAIDQRSKEIREDSHIAAEPGEQMEWLCRQLLEYPKRIDERYTTNQQFLMVSAARTIAAQAARIAELEKPVQVVANITGGVLQGASSDRPADIYVLDFDDVPEDDPASTIELDGKLVHCGQTASVIEPGFVQQVIEAPTLADDNGAE